MAQLRLSCRHWGWEADLIWGARVTTTDNCAASYGLSSGLLLMLDTLACTSVCLADTFIFLVCYGLNQVLSKVQTTRISEGGCIWRRGN